MPLPFYRPITMMTLKEWIELAGLLVVVGGVLWRLSAMATQLELSNKQQTEQISKVEQGLEKLSGLVIELTKVSGRLDRLEDRQLAEGRRIDEITKRMWRRVPVTDTD